MWLKWLPWRFMVKRFARAQGFGDPIGLLSQLNRFAQPAEVLVPAELLRAGAVLHARGLINSQAIQHNLDWIWPYWVHRQFDPSSRSFIPRAFSLTHINLTHRNWTAVGVPDSPETPIVDPRGLVMPFYDSWSIDCWVVCPPDRSCIPSRQRAAEQKLSCDDNLRVETRCEENGLMLTSEVQVVGGPEERQCLLTVDARSPGYAWMVLSVRPCNPEGISFIHDISIDADRTAWTVNKKGRLFFSSAPDDQAFSRYHDGDVFRHIVSNTIQHREGISCSVGLATGAALFKLTPDSGRRIYLTIPLTKGAALSRPEPISSGAQSCWHKSLSGACRASVPDVRFQVLYDAAVRTLLLHTAQDIYAGPFTYKRFWIRDAAMIAHALLCAGLFDRAAKVIDRCIDAQTAAGYFMSQEGEWDSNGQVLWTMNRYCDITGASPPKKWLDPVLKGASWIVKKLTAANGSPHGGLLPPGFSAEHLGPNDYYYWDDFWSAAGLRAAARVLDRLGRNTIAAHFADRAQQLLNAIDSSLEHVSRRLSSEAVPASPYRRMDSGAVGSLVASYPLQLYAPEDVRVSNTADYLLRNCIINGAFFHDIIHSGINPYLTLHIAQTLLRGGDTRFFSLMESIARLASPTGQWPEAIHPQLGSGCMGDGQHVWAAAEWVLMLRNCFVREEGYGRKLVLCSGVNPRWLKKGASISFGPAPTSFGTVAVNVESDGRRAAVSWDGSWHSGRAPLLAIRPPGSEAAEVSGSQSQYIFSPAKEVQ